MAAIEGKEIQELLDRIIALSNAIHTAGDVARVKLQGIRVNEVLNEGPWNNGTLDVAAWSELTESQQIALHSLLIEVRDAVGAAADLDGPANPKQIMYATYASNPAIVLLTVIGFVLTGVLLWGICAWWSEATGTDFAGKIQAATVALQELEKARDRAAQVSAMEINARIILASSKDDEIRGAAEQSVNTRAQEALIQRTEVARTEKKANLAALEVIQAMQKGVASEHSVLIMVVLLGALGGTVHFVSSLVTFIGNRQLMRSWLAYYLSLPITGAALAPIVYMMLRVGILTPSGVSGEGSSVANLNLIGIYAFAALTGLFAKIATTKLGEVFGTIFRTEEPASKDAVGSKKPPGANTSASG